MARVKLGSKIFEAGAGENLGQLLSRSVPGFRLPCGGYGYCGKCLVRVRGTASPPSLMEEKLGVTARGLRLACQVIVMGDVEVELVQQPEAVAALIDAPEVDVPVESPVATIIATEFPKPRNSEPLTRTLLSGHSLSPEAVEVFSRLRPGDRTSYYVNHLGLVYRARRGEPSASLGLAVDVGTSKIAGYLVDLVSGRRLAYEYVENPQTRYGADVVTRLTRIIEEDLLDGMRSDTLRAIERLAATLAARIGATVHDIAGMVVVGNAAMIHVLLGLRVDTLATAPYAPILGSPVEGPAPRLGLRALRYTWVHVPPPISGFVGSDALAATLASELLGIPKPYLLMDLGTNTELVLVAGNRCHVASTPAGPAIEGHVSSGMTGALGGVVRVELDEEGRATRLEVLGGSEPRGFTGAGVLSLMAELVRKRLVDRGGRLRIGEKNSEGIRVLRVADGLVFTQLDVREFQKAKAAIHAAWQVLLEEAGFKPDDLEAVVLAGSLGTAVDPRDAAELGLVPRARRLLQLGNLAGAGAEAMLKSGAARRMAAKLAGKAVHVDLASNKRFRSEWIRKTMLY